jgi:hypothetical protein
MPPAPAPAPKTPPKPGPVPGVIDDVFALSSNVCDIDPNRLPEEILRHSAMYLKFAMQLQNARNDERRFDQQLDLDELDLAKRIRRNPQDFDLEKATDSAVKEMIKSHEDFAARRQQLLSLKHKIGILDAIVNACDHRKRMLELYVDIWKGGWHADPKIDGPRASPTQQTANNKSARTPIDLPKQS